MNALRLSFGLLGTVSALCIALSTNTRADDVSTRFYIGTYAGGKSQGIYVSSFDPATGRIGPVQLAAKAVNPSFLALPPKGEFLYSVGEVGEFQGRRGGLISAYRIEPASGRLELLNQESSGGAGPCHLSLAPNGCCVMVANYSGGSIAALPIGKDGKLAPAASVIQHQGSSVNSQRQSGPHAHQIVTDPSGRLAAVCDLGLDKVLLYDLDAAKASLVPHNPPWTSVAPGSGPRHIAFHPSGKFAYVVNEMASTVTAFSYDAKHGELKSIQTISTLPQNFSGASSCAEIEVHRNGKILYASNRGHDSIAAYEIDKNTGLLALLQHQSSLGKTPRHFAVDPSGKWLLAANQDSDTIAVLAIDKASGRLIPTGDKAEVGKPVCLAFAPRH